MLEIGVKKMDFDGKNTIFSRIVNLDTHLDLIILISTKDKSFGELFQSKVLDSMIDKISPKDTYKDFSSALENINSFLSAWKDENSELRAVHAIVGILDKNNFLFSTIGSPSCYLINSHSDVIEVTEKEESRKDFDFISNGEVADRETIVLGTTRILDYLSKGDLIDGTKLDNIEGFNDNIEMILRSEKPKKNTGIISFRTSSLFVGQKESKLSQYTNIALQFLDNNVAKTVIAHGITLKKKILSQSKQVKNTVFLGGLVICSVFLYIVLSSFIGISSGLRDTEKSKTDLLTAREYVRLASENINNPDVFSLNIEQGENIISSIQDKELFLNDVSKILDDISILKKQFNGIETFVATEQNTLFTSDTLQKPIKILSIANKVYIVDQKTITGPIIAEQTPEVHTFTQFTENDSFIDAVVQETDIILMTSLGKVVSFSRSNFFSYLDVQNQPTWEQSNIIDSYGTNLYLLNKIRNQIFRHKKVAGKYEAGDPYLKDEDATNIGIIRSIAIDGGIYILKNDLSLVKLFVSPAYRLESIILNGLPKNYEFTTKDSKTFIYTAPNLNYFYMLLENKVLVFQPNTKRYQDVKSMKYLGQVEARDFDIQDFFVANDKEIFLLGDKGLYKMGFEISDDKLIVR